MINSLKPNEILRGFGVFEDVLSNSKKLSFKNLVSFVNVRDKNTDCPVQVGFLLSKKKLKKLTTETGFAVY